MNTDLQARKEALEARGYIFKDNRFLHDFKLNLSAYAPDEWEYHLSRHRGNDTESSHIADKRYFDALEDIVKQAEKHASIADYIADLQIENEKLKEMRELLMDMTMLMDSYSSKSMTGAEHNWHDRARALLAQIDNSSDNP